MPKKLFAVIGVLAVVSLFLTWVVSQNRSTLFYKMMGADSDTAMMREPAVMPSIGFDGGMGSGEMGMMTEDRALGGLSYPYPYYPDEALGEENRVYLQSAYHEVVVKDVSGYVQQLKDYFAGVDARVLNTSQANTDRYQTAYLYVKVPVDRFDEAVAKISQGVDKVVSENVSMDDVTGTVVSQAEQVERLEQQVVDKETELAGLTENTTQWRLVNNQLQNLRRQLEAAQDNAEDFSETTQYASISIQIADSERYFKGMYRPYQPDFRDTVYDAWLSLQGSLSSLVVTLIWIAVYAVLWAPVVAIVWWIWKKRQGIK